MSLHIYGPKSWNTFPATKFNVGVADGDRELWVELPSDERVVCLSCGRGGMYRPAGECEAIVYYDQIVFRCGPGFGHRWREG